MRKLVVIVALALFSTSAHAKVHEFKFGGRHIRIDVARHCKKANCVHVYERTGGSRGRASATTAVAPVVAAIPPTTASDSTPKVEPKAAEPKAEPRTEPKAEPQAAVPDERKAVARLSLPVNPADEPKAAAAPAPEPAKTTPVGLWLTEKREGKIRIEACGANLCGHQDGKPSEKVLIDMKPTEGNRWSGKIHDSRSDRTYIANISLKNPNALKVQGCVFGGLFCGGETWTRVE
jgi:Uncharacterized protein conserved in bacteria (DUF2147)